LDPKEAASLDGRLIVDVRGRSDRALLEARVNLGKGNVLPIADLGVIVSAVTDGDLLHVDVRGNEGSLLRLTLRGETLVYAVSPLPGRAGLAGGCYEPPRLAPGVHFGRGMWAQH